MNYVSLPRGIPTCSGACDLYVWKRPVTKFRMLCNDFDIFMIVDGALRMTWANGFTARIGSREFAIVPPYAPVNIEKLRHETSYWFCHFNFRMLPRNLHTRLREDFVGPVEDVAVPVVFSATEAPQIYKEYRRLAGLKPGGSRAPWRFSPAPVLCTSRYEGFSKTGLPTSPAAPSLSASVALTSSAGDDSGGAAGASLLLPSLRSTEHFAANSAGVA